MKYKRDFTVINVCLTLFVVQLNLLSKYASAKWKQEMTASIANNGNSCRVSFDAFNEWFAIDLKKKDDVLFDVYFSKEAKKKECLFVNDSSLIDETLHICQQSINGAFKTNKRYCKIKYLKHKKKHVIRCVSSAINERNARNSCHHIPSKDDNFNINSTFKSDKEFELPVLHLPVLVFVDRLLLKSFENNEKLLKDSVQRIFQKVAFNFRELRVNVTVANIVIWKKVDFVKIYYDSFKTLEELKKFWRKNYKNYSHCAQTAHVLTGRRLNVAGIAATHSICFVKEEAISLTSTYKSNGAQIVHTVSHELAHVLWQLHDKSHCLCEHGPNNCIMSAVDFIPTKWSSCTILRHQELCKINNFQCLQSMPVKC
ncbi:metalloproteinase-like protein [Leptotrombidium deliense]|uniref:Metalloproteinase-like protein n=1 Tax=Leptotrombidium deliense TaxID=299467 RepID=A0A443SJ58_9ACAR|nr:metalloproteinase-like protein [Leptotrombidium deliense]